ncbi:MAG TPA: hypothetical protein VFU71_19755 [Burkholderiaceae bacterium]|nr:hypothetical protein [Burkholderiaceae bacterium]
MTTPPTPEPPSDHRASVAVGLAPVFVAVVFTLIVSRLIAFDSGVAIFLACTAWVVYEMFDYQRAVDAYHLQCIQGHPGLRVAPIDSMAFATDAEAARGEHSRGFGASGFHRLS